jgi:hypothetical protein
MASFAFPLDGLIGITPNPFSSDPSSIASVDAIEKPASQSDAAKRIKEGRSFQPPAQQQTRNEVVNMDLLARSLGNPFSVRKIPYSTLRDMVTDPMIAFALFYIRTPLSRAQWKIECPDAQVAAFVDRCLRDIYASYLLQLTNSLHFGSQAIIKRFTTDPAFDAMYRNPQSDTPEDLEKVWTSDNVDPIVWKRPIACPPENVLPVWTAEGDFDGFNYTNFPMPQIAQYGQNTTYGTHINTDFALWYTNEREAEFGSIYGRPRTSRVYRYYWSYWYRWALADRSYESKADPAKIIYYPGDMTSGFDETTGLKKDYAAEAMSIGLSTRSGSVTALPGDMVMGFDDRPTNTRAWEIKYLENGENFSLLDESFHYLDIQKLRGMFLPEQAVVEGRGGSSSRNVAAQLGELYHESQQVLMDDFDDYTNRFMIPQLLALNFPDRKVTARKVTTGYANRDSDLFKQVIQLVGNKYPEQLSADVPQMLADMGVPLMTQDQIRARDEQAAKEVAASKPPLSSGTAGGAAAVTMTGFGDHVYTQMPDMILLEDTFDPPSSPHYDDKTTKALSRRLHKMWQSSYKELYGSLVNHLRIARVQLADTSQPPPPPSTTHQLIKIGGTVAAGNISQTMAQEAAKAMLSTWTAPAMVLEAAGEATKLTLVALMANAARKSLRSVNLSTDVISSNVERNMSEYAKTRGTALPAQVVKTVRDELEGFIAGRLRDGIDQDQLADLAAEHFDSFPTWKSDRVVINEVRNSYNESTLLAGEAAGVQMVRISDASDGHDEHTDQRCKDRDGAVVTIDQARQEEEHPYGTLYFTLMPSTEALSVERVDTFPKFLQAPDLAQAAYDPASETIFVLTDAPVGVEQALIDSIQEDA